MLSRAFLLQLSGSELLASSHPLGGHGLGRSDNTELCSAPLSKAREAICPKTEAWSLLGTK